MKGTLTYRKLNFFTTSALFNCILRVNERTYHLPKYKTNACIVSFGNPSLNFHYFQIIH